MAFGGSWLIRRLRSISPQPTKQKASSPLPPPLSPFRVKIDSRLLIPPTPQESHYAICGYYYTTTLHIPKKTLYIPLRATQHISIGTNWKRRGVDTHTPISQTTIRQFIDGINRKTQPQRSCNSPLLFSTRPFRSKSQVQDGLFSLFFPEQKWS